MRALVAATVARGSYTPLYASVQQMAGLPADPRDDVYSLGVIWHQLLTGDLTRGVGADYAEDLLEAGVGQPMIALLGQCVAGKPERRPADARRLADQLNSLLAVPPSAAVSVPAKDVLPARTAERPARSEQINLYAPDKECSKKAQPVTTRTIAAPELPDCCKEAKALLDKGEYDLAIAACTKTLEADPNNAWSYAIRGAATRCKKPPGILGVPVVWYDQAIADLTKATELAPDFAYAFYSRGETYRLKELFDQAISDLNRAVQINPEYAWAYAVRGTAYQGQGDLQQALNDLSEAVRLDPKLAWAYFSRGEVHEKKGDKSKARADYEEAVHLDASFKPRLDAKLEAERKAREAAEQNEAERQRRHRPRGSARRLAAAVFGVAFVGPVLGAVVGEVLRLFAVAMDWMLGTNACGWANHAIEQMVVRLLGDQIDLALAGGSYRLHIDLDGETNWWMVSGLVLGAVMMAVYGWIGGWYANADSDRAMRWQEAILGAAIPGLFLGAVIAVLLRAIGGLIAWPFGWEIGGYLAWAKWGTVVGACICFLIGGSKGWTGTNYGVGPQRHFWRRAGSSLKNVAIGLFVGGIIATVLRAIGGLIAWPFGWEIGGWLVWTAWGAGLCSVLGACVGWDNDL